MAIDPTTVRLVLVGNICAQWAFIEYQFAMTIWRLLRLDEETGKITTGGLDMNPRANMAINLANHLNAPRRLQAALTAARKEVQAASERRNQAVHGVTFTSPAKPSDFQVEVHRGPGKRQRSSLPNEELKSLGTELVAIGSALHAALEAHSIVDASGIFVPAADAIARKTRSTSPGRESQPSSKSS